MLALEPRAYHKVAGLVHDVPFNTLFAQVVVEGQVPGSVFVDDPGNPRACYVQHPHGMSLLAGETRDPHFQAALVAHLTDARGLRHHDEWLQIHPRAWKERLVDVLGEREHTRLNFAFDPTQFAKLGHPSLQAGDVLVPIDAAMFDAFSGAVVPRHFWRDADHFLRDGVGFAIVRNGDLAATAFSAFVRDGQLEIGVETKPAYRGAGHALRVCAALIAHGLARGLEPVWSCREENEGSVRLAGKLGFVPSLRLPYFRLLGS